MVSHGEGDVIGLIINTTADGYNGGRQYIFSLESDELFKEWDAAIEKQAAICYKEHNKQTRLEAARVTVPLSHQ